MPAAIHASGAAPAGPGKRVSIHCTLRTNGTIGHMRSAMRGDEPLEYPHGSGRLLPALERAIEGKWPGERLVVSLSPGNSYGERDHTLQQRVPGGIFGDGMRLKAGMCFIGLSGDDRHLESIMVTGVDQAGGTVLVDTNHPLAGMSLEFEITIVAVRNTGGDEMKPGREREAG